MTNSSSTLAEKQDNKIEYGALDASKNNRAPSASPEKMFLVKYSSCYGNSYSLEELKDLAIFDILAYETLTDKQIVHIQKNLKNLQDLSFEEIDSRRTKAVIKNKEYTEPKYKLVNYHFLKKSKINIVYSHNDELDAFIMELENDSIEDTISKYNEKIKEFKKTNSYTPRAWAMRVMVLKEILKLEKDK